MAPAIESIANTCISSPTHIICHATIQCTTTLCILYYNAITDICILYQCAVKYNRNCAIIKWNYTYHTYNAIIQCSCYFIAAQLPNEYDLHLFGGSSPNEGRLEYYYQGEWGTVCDIFWDLQDATVACRQLGYANAIRATTDAEFGAGTGKIWVSSAVCSGHESKLRYCQHSLGLHSCTHDRDAGVVCGARKYDHIILCSELRNVAHRPVCAC